MNNNQKELPLITLRGITVYPSLTMNLDVGREKSVRAIEAAMEQSKEILLVSQKDLMNNEPNVEDIYNIVIIARITNLVELPNKTIQNTIEGINRIKVDEFIDTEKLLTTNYTELVDNKEKEIEAKALNRKLLEQFKAYIKVTQQISEDKLAQVLEIQDPHHLTYAIANEIPINLKEKQELLEIDDIFERNKQLLIKISNEQEV